MVFDGDMVVYDTESNAYKNEIIYFADCVNNNLPVEKVKAEELAAVLDIIGNI